MKLGRKFFDSHGGLYEVCSPPTVGVKDVINFGPGGWSRPVTPPPGLYEAGESSHRVASRWNLIEKEGEWEFLKEGTPELLHEVERYAAVVALRTLAAEHSTIVLVLKEFEGIEMNDDNASSFISAACTVEAECSRWGTGLKFKVVPPGQGQEEGLCPSMREAVNAFCKFIARQNPYAAAAVAAP